MHVGDVIRAGAVPALINVLSEAPSEKVDSVVTAIANVATEGKPEEFEFLLQGVIPPLAKILKTTNSFEARTEAARVISKATDVSLVHIQSVVEEGCIGPLVDCFNSDDQDIVESGLLNILEVGSEVNR